MPVLPCAGGCSPLATGNLQVLPLSLRHGLCSEITLLFQAVSVLHLPTPIRVLMGTMHHGGNRFLKKQTTDW